ncbi:MAG TPA: ribonuclease H [Kofleriaceae bacterium]|nr:ribonuclease H [Kofleriaceae bacterium]
MPWLKHRLRDADVWAKVDEGGALVTDRDGRVEIVYKPADGARVYRAGARNLAKVAAAAPVEIVVGEPAPEKSAAAPANGAVAKTPTRNAGAAPRGKALVTEENATAHALAEIAKAPANAIHVWTDGACSGNPGPAGIGAVIVDAGKETELSEYLGDGTNIVAELTAILRALETIEDRTRPVIVYTDSQFSIDMLTKGWKAKKNIELVAEVRQTAREFKDLRFVWVRGHANVPLNMRCDELARQAVARRR